MTPFRPRLLKLSRQITRLVAPELKNSQFAYYEMVRQVLDCKPQPRTDQGPEEFTWLDIGCGHHIFGHWMDREEREAAGKCPSIFGLDASFEALQKHRAIRNRTLGDILHAPFRGSSFDLVTANMVFEHLERPFESLLEIGTLLKPGGTLVLHTPNRRHYLVFIAALLPRSARQRIACFLDGRAKEDVFPTLYRANTPKRVRLLAQTAGFEVLEIRLVNSSVVTGMLGPLVVVELLISRLLSLKKLRNFRSNMIVLLRKAECYGPAAEAATDAMHKVAACSHC